MALSSRSVFTFLVVNILLSIFNAQASDNDYLKMLESEAKDAKLDQSGQLKDKEQASEENSAITKRNWNWKGDIDSESLPSGLAQDEFATLLKQNFYGTFVFYRKLNSVDQNTIYYHYAKASPAALEPVRQDILNHLKK
jgi:hypothetical protein